MARAGPEPLLFMGHACIMVGDVHPGGGVYWREEREFTGLFIEDPLGI